MKARKKQESAIDIEVREYFEERAAIGEYERGMNRLDSERAARALADRLRSELEEPLLFGLRR